LVRNDFRSMLVPGNRLIMHLAIATITKFDCITLFTLEAFNCCWSL